jgi:hypothetical protein
MSHKKDSSSVVVPTGSAVEPLLVTTARASELLSISAWEVRRLVRKGLLQHKKLSKTNWLISVSSLKKFASV